jgi:hypothetical protein
MRAVRRRAVSGLSVVFAMAAMRSSGGELPAGPPPHGRLAPPSVAGAWSLSGVPRRIEAPGNFDYMDGGGELYLAYRFNRGLIAGTDPVAVEAVGLKILTAKREALRREPWPLSPPPLCVAAADEVQGLGTSRLDEIAIDPKGWTADLLV